MMEKRRTLVKKCRHDLTRVPVEMEKSPEAAAAAVRYSSEKYGGAPRSERCTLVIDGARIYILPCKLVALPVRY